MNKQVLIVHPTGNANVRQAVLALHETARLAAFHTTVAWKSDSFLGRVLPSRYRAILARRGYPGIPPHLIHLHPWNEVARLMSIKLKLTHLHRNEVGLFCFESMTNALDDAVARIVTSYRKQDRAPAAIYAYDGCALKSFIAAKRRGIRCLYEVPVSYYQSYSKLLLEEKEINSEWASTWTGNDDSPEKLQRKDLEVELADALFVASTYSAQALKAFPGAHGKSIYKIGYGAPAIGPARMVTSKENPLRVLYVGSLSQRKGISYMFQAMDQLTIPFHLTLVGRGFAYPKILQDRLSRYEWIETTPHGKVLELMREHDVLVFPTLTDGFGLVILEAMSQGTVVISTPNSAAPDVIEDGKSGLIVPIRNADSIAAALTRFHEDRDYLAQMSEAARRTAEEFTWESYRTQWSEAISECLA